MILQWVIFLILFYSIYRAIQLFRNHNLGIFGTLFTVAISISIGIFLIYPESSSIIALSIGVGRGADAGFLITIIFLLIMNFKLYIKTERLDRDITTLTSEVSKKFHQH